MNKRIKKKKASLRKKRTDKEMENEMDSWHFITSILSPLKKIRINVLLGGDINGK